MSDGGAAGGLSEDGDAVGVASEMVDVLLDPLQGLNHVQHAHVARGLVSVQAHET